MNNATSTVAVADQVAQAASAFEQRRTGHGCKGVTVFMNERIAVGRLKEVLAQVPDDHSLVPSQVYGFFIVDRDGRNMGYVSASAELHWWSAEDV